MIRNILNSFVSMIKKEPFKLDEQIPLDYLFAFFFNKVVCFCYGSLILCSCKIVFLHPTSVIKCKSKIHFGNNLSIARNCYIDALSIDGISFGDNVSMGKYTHIECTGNLRFLGKGFKVGNNVGLGTHGHYGCAGGLEIGSDTIIGNYVSFHPESHNFSDLNIPIRLQGVNHKGIKIGENCWIGAKAIFLDGSDIGNGCIVGAGAVVRGVFPDNCIIGGVPAKILKYRN